MDINPHTFSHDLVVGELVKYFNALPDIERTILPTDFPLYNVKVAEKASGKIQFVIGDLAPEEIYVGEVTYTWVGARGTALVATSSSFFEVSKYIKPNTSVDDFQLFVITEANDFPSDYVIDSEFVLAGVESNAGDNPVPPDFTDTQSVKMFTMHTHSGADMWLVNPSFKPMLEELPEPDKFVRIRPVYSMEQFVFNFPPITRESYGWIEDYRTFCQMVSLKRLVFDERTEFAFTYNYRHASTNTTWAAKGDRLSFQLIWSPDRHTPAEPTNPASGEVKILDLTIKPSLARLPVGFNGTVPFTVEEYTTTLPEFKNGVSGLFYWTTFGQQLPEPYFLDGLTLTMYVKTVNEDFDRAIPLLIAPV